MQVLSTWMDPNRWKMAQNGSHAEKHAANYFSLKGKTVSGNAYMLEDKREQINLAVHL